MRKRVVSFGPLQREVRLVVFDKDGLMFDRFQFWSELARSRHAALARECGAVAADAWARAVGVRLTDWHVNPSSPFALASPAEETAVMAGHLYPVLGLPWDQCRVMAERAMQAGDDTLDLTRALKPLPGFPRVVSQLREAGVGVAVATSDSVDRALRSLALFDLPMLPVVTPEHVAKGKPAPDMLRLLADRFGVHAKEMAMVGDAPVDYQMARAFGCTGVLVQAEPTEREAGLDRADVTLASLDEIVVTDA